MSKFCGGIDVASIKVSKLFSWLPDNLKYGNKGREKIAIERYKLSSITYIKLLDLAISNAVNEMLVPLLKNILKDIQLNEEDKKEVEEKANQAEKEQYKISIDTFSIINEEKISEIINKIVEPLLPCLVNIKSRNKNKESLKGIETTIETTKEKLIKKTNVYFNIFILNLTTEFPEFNLWVDLKTKEDIINELSKYNKSQQKINKNIIYSLNELQSTTNKALKYIENLNDDKFTKIEGFPSFESTFESLFKVHEDNIINKLDENKRKCIEAHHKFIKEDIEKRLSNDDTIEGIVYPKNKEIYIAQGYNAIDYKQTGYKKSFLTPQGFNEYSTPGEDIGKYLLKKIMDPNTTLNPIIILGNPGAGKSIFSKHFAEKLCNTNDFIPFLIRLRDVASNSTNVSEHINKGIAQSIGYTQEINWLELADLFKDRIPVVILDGFDELMQSSEVDLNNYVIAIRELQNKALNSEICLKVILTSRITVMQDVSIPSGTTILRLNQFDEQRKSLWIDIWNSFQNKNNYNFHLPATNKKIKELSQEPLLLFMLAVYDFPDNKLLSVANDDVSFNQSHLYNSLLSDFGKRQLQKQDNYLNKPKEDKEKEEELFRLRLGMIALLMFLKDSTNKNIKRLEEELRICRLNESNIKPRDVLTGFFFVHQNKSTEEGGHENINYEFLHKSFGEFLTADFILRIAKKITDKKTKDLELFRFCFGYNWLNKHPEIQKFLFEHALNIFNLDKNEEERVIEEITDSLYNLFDGTLNEFPISRFTIIDPKTKIEHLAIYSQNLIFLWLSLSKENVVFDSSPFKCNMDSGTVKDDTFTYLAQDREEIDPKKLFWKRICSLWQLVGNYQSVAKIYEWIYVAEEAEKIILKKRSKKIELTNNLSQASLVACNDFNFILSLFDVKNEIDNKKIISELQRIYKQKPELSSLGNDAILFRLEINNEKILFDFLIDQNLNRKQLESLFDRFILFDGYFSLAEIPKFGKKLLEKSRNYRIFSKQIKLINYFYDKIHFTSWKLSFLNDYSKEIIREYEPSDDYTSFFITDYITFINNISDKYFDLVYNKRRLYERIFHNIRKATLSKTSTAIEFITVITKPENLKIISHFLPHDYWEELFKVLLSNEDPFYNDNNYSILNCLILISDYKENIVLKNKKIVEFIKRSYRFLDIEYLSIENPMLILKYIGMIKKIYKNTNLIYIESIQTISVSIFERIMKHLLTKKQFNLKCLTCDGRFDCDRSNNYFGREVIIILNQVAEYLPDKKVYRSDIERLFKYNDNYIEIESFSYENILFMIECFKLMSIFDIKFDNFKRNIQREFSEYLDRNNIVNYKVLFELLKAINETGRKNEVFSDGFIKYIIHEIINCMKINAKEIRENPEIALECMNFLLLYGQIEIALDIFPEFKRISKDDRESLSYLRTFLGVFKK